MKIKSEKKTFYEILKSPVGNIFIFSSENSLTNIYFATEKIPFKLKNCINESTTEIKKALEFFNLYFYSKKTSDLNKITSVMKFDFEEFTSNEINVYKKLLKIKFSETVSYKELSAISGFPGGARFIGNCMAKNRFPIIIPCHRVIKSDGSIGNYSGGPGIKLKLLRHEGVML